MELTFIGRGSAFNQKEGNNSAYFIENGQMFLIDCGENIFERMLNNNLFENIEVINIMITHTHSDHIGSLGSLVMYCYYELHIPVNIISSSKTKQYKDIDILLKIFGCSKKMYTNIDEKKLDNKYNTFESIRYIKTDHCDELNCYGILFKTKEGIVYYSGDTNEINNIKALISSNEPIDKIYVDTTTADFPGNVHFNINSLAKVIPEEIKKKIYCMHINNDDCLVQAKINGFNEVKTIEIKEKLKIKKR